LAAEEAAAKKMAEEKAARDHGRFCLLFVVIFYADSFAECHMEAGGWCDEDEGENKTN